jgi:DNA adenine methylase
MRYQGGKEKIAGRLARVIEAHRQPGQLYIEPFVGAASVVARVRSHGPRVAADAFQPLITLHRAMQIGWKPPTRLSEEEWLRIKANPDPSDPLTAFAGFGMSFGAAWFTGYAREIPGHVEARYVANSLLTKARGFGGVEFICRGYLDTPEVEGAVIYCDPPYSGTAGYPWVGDFDHDVFWDWVRHMAAKNVVLVSEYNAPDDFELVWEHHKRETMSMYNTGGTRADSVFRYEAGRKPKWAPRNPENGG